MRLLITGGCGFLGSNLAARGIQRGDEILIIDNLTRLGAADNLAWLQSIGEFDFSKSDVRDGEALAQKVREFVPQAVFHLAGQVAMTTSLANPRFDFDVNALGTLNLLESVRKEAPEACVLYSSTNKVYGDLLQYRYEERETRYVCPEFPQGFDESVPLNFHSPYGCSKGAADQYVLDFARMYGLRTVVFRHSSMYGGRQFATYDQGWIGWFCEQTLRQSLGHKEHFTISGNGKQVRDVLHADDMVDLYFRTVDSIDRASGHAFNIGGGIGNSLSLLELFSILHEQLDYAAQYERLPPRASDQLVFVADVRKATEMIGWRPKVSVREGLRRMTEWVRASAPSLVG